MRIQWDNGQGLGSTAQALEQTLGVAVNQVIYVLMGGHRLEGKVWGKGGDAFAWGVGQVIEDTLTTQQKPQRVTGNSSWEVEVTMSLVT